MLLLLQILTLKRFHHTSFTNLYFSPIMEEGLLIGIAIVAILIVLGIVFGIFDWIADSFGSLFDHF